jgi:hypothetical protein
MQAFASMRSIPFIEIDDREKLYKDMKALGEIETKISWEDGFGYGHGQRGSNIE